MELPVLQEPFDVSKIVASTVYVDTLFVLKRKPSLTLTPDSIYLLPPSCQCGPHPLAVAVLCSTLRRREEVVDSTEV